MTEVLLLQGPDGNRYKATKISTDVWYVILFLNFNKNFISEWWKNQCGFGCWSWNRDSKYQTLHLKKSFLF